MSRVPSFQALSEPGKVVEQMNATSPDVFFENFLYLPQITFSVKQGELADKLATHNKLCRALLTEFDVPETRRKRPRVTENQAISFLVPQKSQLSPQKARNQNENRARQNSCTSIAKSKDYRITKKHSNGISAGLQIGTELENQKFTKSLRWNTLETLNQETKANTNIFDDFTQNQGHAELGRSREMNQKLQSIRDSFKFQNFANRHLYKSVQTGANQQPVRLSGDNPGKENRNKFNHDQQDQENVKSFKIKKKLPQFTEDGSDVFRSSNNPFTVGDKKRRTFYNKKSVAQLSRPKQRNESQLSQKDPNWLLENLNRFASGSVLS